MPLNLHEAAVPPFVQTLTALSAVLDKAEAMAKARKVEPAVLLNARLACDMFPLVRQVQIAGDFAKGACARLAGVDVPSYPDSETSIVELKARVRRTIEFITSLRPEQFDGAETRDVTIKVAGNPVTFKGKPYLLQFAIPNYYFHLTIAYAILRHNGVELGKRDFLGAVPGMG